MGGTVTEQDVDILFKKMKKMPGEKFAAGAVAVFSPPPLSPTPSVKPDASAFGTATLHAESRRTDFSTRDAHQVRLRFFSA